MTVILILLVTTKYYIPEFHDYIEGGVEQEVDDEDSEHEAGKVLVLLRHHDHLEQEKVFYIKISM